MNAEVHFVLYEMFLILITGTMSNLVIRVTQG